MFNEVIFHAGRQWHVKRVTVQISGVKQLLFLQSLPKFNEIKIEYYLVNFYFVHEKARIKVSKNDNGEKNKCK